MVAVVGRQESRGVERVHTSKLPGLSLPDTLHPSRVHRKLSEMFRKTGPKSKHDDPIIAHNSFMKESRDRKCELPHWFMLRRI